MASTNVNTNSETVISTDIYEIAEFYDYIRASHIPDLDETSSMVGIFGYMNEMFSQTLQNTLIAISETTNETIPTRAKFTKNVITHALNYGITDINAKPAIMTIMMYLPLSYFEANFVDAIKDQNNNISRWVFRLSRNIPIFVGNFEFHLDYDIIINRIKNQNQNGEYVYTGMYDLFDSGTTNIKQKNPISDITNPYITTLIKTKLEGVEYIAFSVRVHQVQYSQIDTNILTSNSIENKTITFEFDDQLASFDVDIIETSGSNETIIKHLTPVFNGLLDYTVSTDDWCYYEYISENTIRVIFSRDAYVPKINQIVRVNLYLSDGASGNFTYNQPFRIALLEDAYNNYNGMYALIYPLLNGLSSGGKDKKSVSDLKKIIPREASSRGSIINTTDLRNFFNSINDTECRLFFKKKRDNPFERMYYAYMLMRKDGNVYPTNTINIKLLQTDFIGKAGNNNLSINPGTVFYYYNHGENSINDYATLYCPEIHTPDDGIERDYDMTINEDGDYVRIFKYTSPFLITIDDDLITSYFMTIMNENKTFRFDSINTQSNLQFVATNMQWVRNYYTKDGQSNYDNKYTMTLDIAQNDSSDYGLITYHTDANREIVFDEVRIKVYMVLYTDDTATTPYRYKEGVLIQYDPSRYMSTFKFEFLTDDKMDLNNRINIIGVYNAKPEELQTVAQAESSHGYMGRNTFAKIFILAEFDQLYGVDQNGNKTYDGIDYIIPQKADIITAFLANDISAEIDGNEWSVVDIMRANSEYMNRIPNQNTNPNVIIRWLKANKDSDFVKNTLLNDAKSVAVINSYNYEDLSKYTLCNVLSVDNGIDFYHDYSALMRSGVNVNAVQERDSNGNLVYIETSRVDAFGTPYTEYKPSYLLNENGKHVYEYTMLRVPVLKAGYLSSEELVQDFIYEVEERRKYIEVCLEVLEDTFDIDFKFVNTFGPSKTFYYQIPSSQNFKVKVAIKELNVYSSTVDEDDESNVVGVISFGQYVNVTKVRGQWGYITDPFVGWIKLSDTTRVTTFIDNVAVELKFALEAQSSADKYISGSIIQDIKEYIEDINEINELHIPNIITLITNNYREQLVYFEFLDVNNYGSSCQHLYLLERDPDIVDIAPEFINVATTEDDTFQPKISVMVY